MTYTINRAFAHRTFGDIGTVAFVAPDGDYMLDGKVLPEGSVAHLLRFALQTLQDAYAGSGTADEATGAFNKKYDALIAGTIGTRSSGEGVDEETTVARQIVRTALKTSWGGKSPKWVTFTGLADAEQATRLDKVRTDNPGLFDDAIAAKMAERKRERDSKAKLAKAISINI